MNTAKKMVLAAVVLPLTLGTASAWAFGGGGKDNHKGPRDECRGGLDRGIMRQLDLTEEQQAQLKEMREAGRDEMKAQFKENFESHQAQMQAHRASVQALVLADTFDQAAAQELAKQMVDQQTERRVKMLEKEHKMLSVLTPEQKAKFVELQQERATECGEKMQKRMNKN